MSVRDLVLSMLKIETRLQIFERRYGLKSANFYQLAEEGRLCDIDGRDDFFDFLEWRGLYKLWLDCRDEYEDAITKAPDLLAVIHSVPVPV
ncbi:MAG: hypothetical protein KKD28_01230 [Chloroflexi bacterium]|nr:hypothetical protein [Chloroflexota bacterium]MBU1660077.1 hypothetical protein [Chloroflexota bacterium]